MKLESHYFLPKEYSEIERFVQNAREECIRLLKDQIFNLVKNGANVSFGEVMENETKSGFPEGTFINFWINYFDDEEECWKNGTRI